MVSSVQRAAGEKSPKSPHLFVNGAPTPAQKDILLAKVLKESGVFGSFTSESPASQVMLQVNQSCDWQAQVSCCYLIF